MKVTRLFNNNMREVTTAKAKTVWNAAYYLSSNTLSASP